MIKYIGSKRTLIDNLVQILHTFPELSSVSDIFSGTSRCGHGFKRAGWSVVSNDHNTYAYTLAQCYVEADWEDVEAHAKMLLKEFSLLRGAPGYFTETFCINSRFFQPHNGERVDAIREAIESKSLDPVLKSVVLTSLMEAADRVDSTCGLQMAYVKKWAKRSYNDLQLRLPDLTLRTANGRSKALNLDANEAAKRIDTDVAYIDPPYNQHSYLSNYHIWESLVLWDKPEVYGIACKRVDCRERKSDYNSKPRHKPIFRDLINSIRSRFIVVSFNNEGYQSRNEMEDLLSSKGEVFVITKDFKRYVGAQIGIHNPSGEKVGRVSHLRNKEFIYLVATPDLLNTVPDALDRLHNISKRSSDVPSTEQAELQSSICPTLNDSLPRIETVHEALRGLAMTQEQLREKTGLSNYQIRMALDALEAQQVIVSYGSSRDRAYSVAAAGAVDARLAIAIDKPDLGPTIKAEIGHASRKHSDPSLFRQAVIDALSNRLAHSSQEIRRVVPVDAAALREILGALQREGLVYRSGQARGTRYRLSDSRTETAASADVLDHHRLEASSPPVAPLLRDARTATSRVPREAPRRQLVLIE